MKKLSIVLALFLMVFLFACGTSAPVAQTPQSTQTPVSQAGEKGRAVFAVSDAAADMGAVSEIELTIDSLRVRKEAGAWVEVDVEQQTFALLDLRDKAAAELLAQVELDAGSYDRLELQVSNVTVVDAEGEHEAKLPGNKLQLEGKMEVEAGADAVAEFDFLADQSLHMTGNGEYVFAPVILLEVRSGASAQVDSGSKVQVSGGRLSAQVEVGMDVHGGVDAGLRISPNAVLSISGSGIVVQTAGQGLVSGTVKSVNAAEGTVVIQTQGNAEIVLHLAGDSTIKIDGSAKTAADLAGKVGMQAIVQYNAETNAIAQVSAGADARTRSEAGIYLNIAGVIKSVDSANGTVTILTDTGAEVVLKVNANSRVNLGGSLLSGLLSLNGEVGSRIEANYDARSKVAARIDAESKSNVDTDVAVNGSLKSVDRLNGTITIVTGGGSELVLKLSSTAGIFVNGASSTMAELAARAGSNVTVRYNRETAAAIEVRAEGSVSTTATVRGTLQNVNTVAGTITVAGENGGQTVLRVGSDTSILVDGLVASFSGLAADIGAGITVTYYIETQVASWVRVESEGSAGVQATVSGVLTAVNPVSGAITIATQAGADLVLDVSSATRVLVDGAVATTATLAAHTGSRITVTYDTGTQVASSISAAGRTGGSFSVAGTLQSVNVFGATLVVLTAAGEQMTIQVTSDTIIMVDGVSSSLVGLATEIGSSLTAEFDGETNLVTSVNVE
ncbi:MAG: DUF4382 domain-containing protein [SAR202 cluster bacterium]|nr:DUF4382 domain-containing protein [SAR202 cluster bacterium]